METGGSKEKKATQMTTSLYLGLRACREVRVWLAKKGRLLSAPKDPQVFLACLGPLDLEDLVLPDPQDPQGHQDHQLS